MGISTFGIKNIPVAMDPVIPAEGLYLIPTAVAHAPHPINDLVNQDSVYAAGGLTNIFVVTGLTKGEAYYWEQGINGVYLVNAATDITSVAALGNTVQFPKFLVSSGQFQASGSSVTLIGGSGTNVDSMILPLGICFQKLWLYPYNSFASGIPTVNSGTVNLGKSGILAATPYLPDALAPTDGPIVYELPLGQKMDLSQILISGGHGDGVFYSFT